MSSLSDMDDGTEYTFSKLVGDSKERENGQWAGKQNWYSEGSGQAEGMGWQEHLQQEQVQSHASEME